MNTAELAKLDLLVVDHVSSLRHLTAGLLRGLAVGKTQMASSGQEALSLMRLAKPDLVLAEWNMPTMDGLALLRAMRADEKLGDIPVVLVMTDVDRHLVEAAVSSGVSDLLVKPYSLQRLENKILGSVRRGVPPAVAALAPVSQALAEGADAVEAKSQRPTILVVDDTPDNLRLMADLFSDDYRVKVADNGEKALAICNGDIAPDLVLLDVMMPGMDGFEVARRLRAQANGETIPVIFVTAMTDEGAQLRGFDLGAVDFVFKPVDPDVLRLRVSNFIRYVELHKRRQHEFDAILAEARRRQALTRQLRDEVSEPLRAAVLALTQLQGTQVSSLLEPAQQLALAQVTKSVSSALEAVGKCET